MFRKSTTSTQAGRAKVRHIWPVPVTAAMVVSLAMHAPSSAADGNLNIGSCVASRTYNVPAGTSVNTSYEIKGAAGNVSVSLTPDINCTGSDPTLTCQKFDVQVPPGYVATSGGTQPATVTVKGAAAFATGDESKWKTTGTQVSDTSKTCTQGYHVVAVSSASVGGWGDPHLTTVDGVHYDFQSAGEFTALRQKGLEIQTRQTPVPTATVPITNAYTGITHCVAIYTAVAAKFGASRITLQPGLTKGEVDPKTMQLRVNGTLTDLGENGIVLRSGGGAPGATSAAGTFDGVIKRAAGGAIEMTDASGTQLVVTPAFWDALKLWYLNVAVYQTSATQGTMGRIADGSWLPAMPDGSSLGPRPEAENDRYEALYTKFAGGWRVTDATSLFDYATGQGTSSYRLDEWPRNQPKSCGIEGQESVPSTTPELAAQACAAVTDPARKVDCQFDVAITGNTGFGKAYETSQGFQPAGTGWAAGDPGGGTGPAPTPQWWKKWWWLILLSLLVVFLVWQLLRRKGP